VAAGLRRAAAEALDALGSAEAELAAAAAGCRDAEAAVEDGPSPHATLLGHLERIRDRIYLAEDADFEAEGRLTAARRERERGRGGPRGAREDAEATARRALGRARAALQRVRAELQVLAPPQPAQPGGTALLLPLHLFCTAKNLHFSASGGGALTSGYRHCCRRRGSGSTSWLWLATRSCRLLLCRR
jgi:hypothetical protein